MNLILIFATFLSPAFASVVSATPVNLTLNWKAEPQFGGFYAAQLNNEFKKRNLDVTLLEGGSGTPTIQMLAAGKTNFAIVSAEEILIARDRGADIKALFATFQTNPQAIMTHQERNFSSLKDVFNSEGTLSLQSGLSYAQFLFKKYPKPKVKIVPDLGGISQFSKDPKHSQQCFFTSEPLLAENAGLKTKTFLVSEEGFNPYTTVVATSAETLKKDPKLVKSFIEAVLAGWTEYLKNPEPTNKYMAGINKAMDAQTFAKSAMTQKPLIETTATKAKHLGVMTDERWSSLISQMKDLKLIKKDHKASELYESFLK